MSSSRWWHYAGAAPTGRVNGNGLYRRWFRLQWVAANVQLQRLGGVEGFFLANCFEDHLYRSLVAGRINAAPGRQTCSTSNCDGTRNYFLFFCKQVDSQESEGLALYHYEHPWSSNSLS